MARYQYRSGIHATGPDLEIVCPTDGYYEKLDSREYYAPRDAVEPFPDVPSEEEEDEVEQPSFYDQIEGLIEQFSFAENWQQTLDINSEIKLLVAASNEPLPTDYRSRVTAELEAAVVRFQIDGVVRGGCPPLWPKQTIFKEAQ